MLKRLAIFVFAIFAFCAFGVAIRAEKLDPDNTIFLDLKDGRVVIKLRNDVAPNHAERMKKLSREGFYDGLTFHRVIDGFMAQTGDPTGTGSGGSSYPDLKAEYSSVSFGRGTVGIAREPGNDDSGNSQFFICFKPAPWLDGQYTIVGEVVDGMEFVDKIKRGEPPVKPDVIVKMQVAADVAR